MLTDNLMDRRSFIGSSDCAAIIGVSPFKTAFQLYQEKIGEYVEDITKEKQKLFDRGKKFEPLILEMLLEELKVRGHDIEIISKNERLRDTEFPFLASESDMVLRLDGEIISAEAKSVNGFASKLWGEPETDDFPIYYQCQTMHDLMVKRRNRCVVAALIGTDDLRIHWIKRDDEIIEEIRKKEIEFWNRVQTKNPPEPTSLKDLNRLYRVDYGETIEADEELLSLYTELCAIKAAADASTNAVSVLSNRIKARMGNAAVLLYGDKKLIAWKSNRDSTKVDWQEAYMDLNPDPAHLEKFTTIKPGTRPFLIKS